MSDDIESPLYLVQRYYTYSPYRWRDIDTFLSKGEALQYIKRRQNSGVMDCYRLVQLDRTVIAEINPRPPEATGESE